MAVPDASDDEQQVASTSDGGGETHDLRGSFVAVLLMAAFFVLVWGGVLWIAMGRR